MKIKDFLEIDKKRKEIKDSVEERYQHNKFYKRRTDYATARKKYNVQNNIILYESYFGRGLICGPYAIFCNLKKDPEFKNFKHIWVLDDLEQHEVELNEYKDDKSVIFVEAHSEEYFKYLSSAKYLITNVTFQSYFTKKEGQIIINTWHGIPLKHLGFDTPLGNVEVSNTLRNFLMTDYLISANKFTTSNFRSAYKLDGMYQGEIIETGYPRNDLIFHTNKEKIIQKFEKYGVHIDPTKKLVVYAPTWKGDKYSDPAISVDSYENFLKIVYSKVDPDKYQILFKPHQIVYKTMRDKGLLKDYYVPATIDTNELLSITDILISDYSSIFFDFLVTDKPILFYINDLESYQEARGLYFDVNDLPGPIGTTPEQIGEWIADIENYKTFFPYENYEKTKAWAVEYDDGNVTNRIKEVVFDKPSQAKVITDFDNGKIKLLINNDTMKTNGITSSMCNLLNHLDYNKYDVTLCAGGKGNGTYAEACNNICAVNKNVRVYYRNTTYNGTIKQNIDNELTLYYGVDQTKQINHFPKEFYKNEFKRCFTGTKFDYIINFSGYSNLLSLVFASCEGTKKLIWLHNDMNAERKRFEDGERRFDVLNTIYPLYDRLVSCSKSVMDVNKEHLEADCLKGKFSYAKNLMDDSRIKKCLQENMWIEYENNSYYVTDSKEKKSGGITLSLIDGIDKNCTNFVTMGRLSMEKNHKNLILAFKEFCEKNENVHLYILGEGPLKSALTKMINKNKLQNKITLTGNLSNPFAFVKQCDCYIMPSLHEGQPMSIMEARLLELSIIVSNFSTAKDSLYENGQLLIGTDVNSILDGLNSFMEGKVPNEYKFDIDAYNEEALHEFESNLEF